MNNRAATSERIAELVRAAEESLIMTPERIAEMQKFILENPIDHSLDEEYEKYCQSYVEIRYDFEHPKMMTQSITRDYYERLKELGKLPDGIE